MWKELSLSDKARMMKLAVKSGITDLRTIEEVYNKYASGGLVHKYDGESEYTQQMEIPLLREYNGIPMTVKQYKERVRQQIRDAAVDNAQWEQDFNSLPESARLSDVKATLPETYSELPIIPVTPEILKEATKMATGGLLESSPDDENAKTQTGTSAPIVIPDMIINAINAAKDKVRGYLVDYANTGKMYSYPSGPLDYLSYLVSPYNSTGVERDEQQQNGHTAYRRALFTKYYGLDGLTDYEPSTYLMPSPYKPQTSSNPDAEYFTINSQDPYQRAVVFGSTAGNYKIDFGSDDKGNYVSVYDVWDLDPTGNYKNTLGGKPVELYDRFYENEYPYLYQEYVNGYHNNKSGARGSFAKGGLLDRTTVYKDDGFLQRLISWFGGNKNKQEEIQTVQEEQPKTIPMTYYNAPAEYITNISQYMPKENGKYNLKDVGRHGDTYYDVIKSRYTGLSGAMRRKGFSEGEIDTLAPILLNQLILEGGYRLTKDNNNFGGMLNPKTRKQLAFNSEADFYDAYLDNLDKKWGDGYLGEGKGWRNATTLQQYADIINREDLGLHTKADFDKYNREHRDAPAYIYTPLWENNDTGLMSPAKFGGIKDRVAGLYALMKLREAVFAQYAKQKNLTLPAEE